MGDGREKNGKESASHRKRNGKWREGWRWRGHLSVGSGGVGDTVGRKQGPSDWSWEILCNNVKWISAKVGVTRIDLT